MVESAGPRWRQLHQEYLLALEQAEPRRDAEARGVDELAAFDAAFARVLGELTGAIDAARSAVPAAPDEPPADGIRAALDAMREEANAAAARAADDPARAFRASVEASLASAEMTAPDPPAGRSRASAGARCPLPPRSWATP